MFNRFKSASSKSQKRREQQLRQARLNRRLAGGLEQLEKRQLLAANLAYDDFTAGMAIDTQENVYVAGIHTQPVDVDPSSTGENWMPASGERFSGRFLAKYSSDGSLNWAKTASDLGMSHVGQLETHVETDDTGGTAEYLYVGGGNDVAKLSLDGTTVWSNGTNRLGRVAIDADGAVYGLGTVYNQDIDVDPEDTDGDGSSDSTLLSSGSQDVYLAKWNSEGIFQWVHRIGGSEHKWSGDLKVHGGVVYASGYFTGTLDPDDTSDTNATLTDQALDDNSRWGDGFIARYDSSGNFLSASQFIDAWVSRMEVDDSGTYYSGEFKRTADLDPSPDTQFLVEPTNIDADHLYIAKLDSNHAFAWGRSYTGSGGSTIGDLQLSAGSLYASGSFGDRLRDGSTVDFGTDADGNQQQLWPAGYNDVFVMRMPTDPDAAGYDLDWVTQMGSSELYPVGPAAERGEQLAVGGAGDVYTSGFFAPGPAVFAGTQILGQGDKDGFVAKLSSTGQSAQWAFGLGSPARIMDNSDAGYYVGEGYSDVGDWKTVSWGNEGGSRVHRKGDGSAVATWQFTNLPEGDYEVYAHWYAENRNATNAPYSINGSAPVRVDQTVVPDDASFIMAGKWKRLGTYTVTGGSISATLSNDANGYVVADGIRIVFTNPLNIAPTTVDDSYTIDEDTQLAVAAPGVLGNDTDGDGDTLTASWVSGPANGSLTLKPDGSFTYTPDANFNGTDSFIYAAEDGNGGSTKATVTLTVSADNDAPVAGDDGYTALVDTTLSVDAPGVLGNDLDVDGDALTAAVLDKSNLSNSAGLTFNSDGSFSYTPDVGVTGQESFTYTVSDSSGASDTGTVTMSFTESPIANALSVTTDEDNSVDITLSGSDVESTELIFEIVNGPAYGSLGAITDEPGISGTPNTDSALVTYTPDADYHGPDSFTYRVTDGDGATSEAVVSLTVNSLNDAPVAFDDSAMAKQGSFVTIDVLANDKDVDGDGLSITNLTQPGSGGSVQLNSDNTVTFVSDGSPGEFTFTYMANDTKVDSNTATVTVQVAAAAKFYVADDDADSAFQYQSNGSFVTSTALTTAAPRGMTATADGTNWVVDASGTVSEYDASGSSQSSWTVSGLSQPEGIATADGSSFWIVDQKANQALQFDSTGAETGSFALHKDNSRATGITTDGTSIWVVNDHPRWDQVFKYDTAGTSQGSWNLDSSNTQPTGITIDLDNPSDLWVVDNGSDRVYQYVGAASTVSGSEAADSWFALASTNSNPQGIADPPADGGTVSSGSLSQQFTADRFSMPLPASRGLEAAARDLAFEELDREDRAEFGLNRAAEGQQQPVDLLMTASLIRSGSQASRSLASDIPEGENDPDAESERWSGAMDELFGSDFLESLLPV